MEVPKWVIDSVIKSAKHYEIARNHNGKVRDWLDKNNMGDDYFVDQLIDSTELMNDPNHFIGFLENDGEE